MDRVPHILMTRSKAANRMSRFPPEPSVLVSVRMTRTAYAQLVGQTFYPPKPFGRWQEPQGSSDWRRRDVGMKIVSITHTTYHNWLAEIP